MQPTCTNNQLPGIIAEGASTVDIDALQATGKLLIFKSLELTSYADALDRLRAAREGVTT